MILYIICTIICQPTSRLYVWTIKQANSKLAVSTSQQTKQNRKTCLNYFKLHVFTSQLEVYMMGTIISVHEGNSVTLFHYNKCISFDMVSTTDILAV